MMWEILSPLTAHSLKNVFVQKHIKPDISFVTSFRTTKEEPLYMEEKQLILFQAYFKNSHELKS